MNKKKKNKLIHMKSLIQWMNKAYSYPINKWCPKKSLDTENFEQGFPVPRGIFILVNKTTMYLYIFPQINLCIFKFMDTTGLFTIDE